MKRDSTSNIFSKQMKGPRCLIVVAWKISRDIGTLRDLIQLSSPDEIELPWRRFHLTFSSRDTKLSHDDARQRVVKRLRKVEQLPFLAGEVKKSRAPFVPFFRSGRRQSGPLKSGVAARLPFTMATYCFKATCVSSTRRGYVDTRVL